MTRRQLLRLGTLAAAAPKAMAAAPALPVDGAAILIPAKYSFASVEVAVNGMIIKGITAIHYEGGWRIDR